MTAPPRSLSQPCRFASGVVAPNRIVKVALSECLADPMDGAPNEQLFRLYHEWAKGGTGVIITGNAMVDHRYRENPRNLVIDPKLANPHRARWTELASIIREHGALAIVQLSHPGRQTPISVSTRPVAPSAIPVRVKGPPLISKMLLAPPRELSTSECAEIPSLFRRAAAFALQCGFDGIQIHAAHGYLLASFLSPLSNRRTDAYGGTQSQRSRVLIETVAACKVVARSSPQPFSISVKLNISDFKRGGLSPHAAVGIVKAVVDSGADFVEISGGTYESPAFMGSGVDAIDVVSGCRRLGPDAPRVPATRRVVATAAALAARAAGCASAALTAAPLPLQDAVSSVAAAGASAAEMAARAYRAVAADVATAAAALEAKPLHGIGCDLTQPQRSSADAERLPDGSAPGAVRGAAASRAGLAGAGGAVSALPRGAASATTTTATPSTGTAAGVATSAAVAAASADAGDDCLLASTAGPPGAGGGEGFFLAFLGLLRAHRLIGDGDGGSDAGGDSHAAGGGATSGQVALTPHGGSLPPAFVATASHPVSPIDPRQYGCMEWLAEDSLSPSPAILTVPPAPYRSATAAAARLDPIGSSAQAGAAPRHLAQPAGGRGGRPVPGVPSAPAAPAAATGGSTGHTTPFTGVAAAPQQHARDGAGGGAQVFAKAPSLSRVFGGNRAGMGGGCGSVVPAGALLVCSSLASPIRVRVLLSGGLRTLAGMRAARAAGAALIGIGRPLTMQPDLSAQLLAAESDMRADALVGAPFGPPSPTCRAPDDVPRGADGASSASPRSAQSLPAFAPSPPPARPAAAVPGLPLSSPTLPAVGSDGHQGFPSTRGEGSPVPSPRAPAALQTAQPSHRGSPSTRAPTPSHAQHDAPLAGLSPWRDAGATRGAVGLLDSPPQSDASDDDGASMARLRRRGARRPSPALDSPPAGSAAGAQGPVPTHPVGGDAAAAGQPGGPRRSSSGPSQQATHAAAVPAVTSSRSYAVKVPAVITMIGLGPTIGALLANHWHVAQMHRIADGHPPSETLSVYGVLAEYPVRGYLFEPRWWAATRWAFDQHGRMRATAVIGAVALLVVIIRIIAMA